MPLPNCLDFKFIYQLSDIKKLYFPMNEDYIYIYIYCQEIYFNFIQNKTPNLEVTL